MTDARPDPKQDLFTAEAEAEQARQRLSGTVAQLQARLDPKLLAGDAKEAGLSVARAGADGARRNPGIIAGAVAATGLFLARHRIARLFRRKPKPLPARPRTSSEGPRS